MDESHVAEVRRILHPTDFSGPSAYALKYAVAFARQFNASLCLLHVVEDVAQALYFDMLQTPPLGNIFEELEEQAGKEIEKIRAAIGPEIRTEALIKRGVPFREIVRVARDLKADMIVVGTHGRSGIKHALFGSVAEKVVRKAPCPVLSVRHPDMTFEMP